MELLWSMNHFFVFNCLFLVGKTRFQILFDLQFFFQMGDDELMVFIGGLGPGGLGFGGTTFIRGSPDPTEQP